MRRFMILSGAVVVMVLMLGCATQPRSSSPFSESWLRQQQATSEMERRREFIRGGETEGSALRVDERGRPRLGVGNLDGLSAEIDYDRGTSAAVKYNWRWNFVRPPHRGTETSP